jgi:hypothetical protein
MTESIIAGLSSPSIMSTASSTYYAPFNSMGHADGVITTESQAQVKNRGAATAKNLTVFVQGNGRGTATLVTLRVNGADTAMSISIPGGGTSVFVEGTPHNISIADGDLVDVAVALGTGGGGIIISSIAVEMVRATAAQMLAAVGSQTMANANGDRIMPPIGVLGTSGSYTTPPMTALEACTFSNLQVNVTTADTATQVFRSIKNLSFGNQAVSVPAGVPGSTRTRRTATPWRPETRSRSSKTSRPPASPTPWSPSATSAAPPMAWAAGTWRSMASAPARNT